MNQKEGFDHNYYYIYIYSRSFEYPWKKKKKRRAKCSLLYLGAEVNGKKQRDTQNELCV